MDLDTEFATAEFDDIVISACQAFSEEDDDGCAYYLRIENNSDEKIHLLSKEFNITDDHGHIYCDHSAGFKGELPALEPGEYFEYADTAPLHSAFGVLYGTCKIMRQNSTQVKDLRIPALSLTGTVSRDCVLN